MLFSSLSQQVDQYQQNEQPPFTLNHWTQKKKTMTHGVGPGIKKRPWHMALVLAQKKKTMTQGIGPGTKKRPWRMALVLGQKKRPWHMALVLAQKKRPWHMALVLAQKKDHDIWRWSWHKNVAGLNSRISAPILW